MCNIMIRHLYTLWSNHYSKSRYHPSPYGYHTFFFLCWELFRSTLFAGFKYVMHYSSLQSPCCILYSHDLCISSLEACAWRPPYPIPPPSRAPLLAASHLLSVSEFAFYCCLRSHKWDHMGFFFFFLHNLFHLAWCLQGPCLTNGKISFFFVWLNNIRFYIYLFYIFCIN